MVKLKVRAGVLVAAATDVVKRGDRLPALKVVTDPEPLGELQVPSPLKYVELEGVPVIVPTEVTEAKMYPEVAGPVSEPAPVVIDPPAVVLRLPAEVELEEYMRMDPAEPVLVAYKLTLPPFVDPSVKQAAAAPFLLPINWGVVREPAVIIWPVAVIPAPDMVRVPVRVPPPKGR